MLQRAVTAALFTVWMNAVSSHPVFLRAAREMVECTGILEPPGNNLRQGTGIADRSSVLPEPEACLLAKGETSVLAGDNRGRFCEQLVNL